jgi:hypothetical protein
MQKPRDSHETGSNFCIPAKNLVPIFAGPAVSIAAATLKTCDRLITEETYLVTPGYITLPSQKYPEQSRCIFLILDLRFWTQLDFVTLESRSAVAQLSKLVSSEHISLKPR